MIFGIIILVLLTISIFLLYKNNYFHKVYRAIKGDKEIENVVKNVSINGSELAFDINTNTFLFPISEEYENNEIN